MKRNHTLFCLHGVFYRLLLLTLDGAVLQTLLIECGFSEEKTGFFFSVMKILQVAAILLLSRAADRATRIKRDVALLFLGTVPLAILLLSLTLVPSLLAGGGAALLYVTGAVYCVVIGAYSILSYKLPYAVMDMRDYGRLSGLSGALGGGASLLLSLVLTILTGAIGYFTTMRLAYAFTLIFALLAVLITLGLREHATPQKKHEESKKSLFSYRPFTLLILPNLLRGFCSGIVAMAVTIGYTCNLLDAATANIAVVITGAVSLLGALVYAAIATRIRSGRILLVSGLSIALLLPLSVLFESTALYLTLYGVVYFFIMQIDHAVPVAVTKFVDYDMISRYTGGRMLLHTLGTSLAGFVAVGICRAVGPLFLMLITAVAQITFSLTYYFYLKKSNL